MIKKLWLSLLSLVAILFVWTTFANPIAPETYYVCSMFENVEIDNYRVVVQNGSGFYEPIVNSCSRCWERPQMSLNGVWWWIYYYGGSGPSQKVFLLDKSINIDDITDENVESKAISIWSIISTYCDERTNKTRVYKIVNSWNYTMLDRTEHYKNKQEIKGKVKNFLLFWPMALIIETLVLFIIAKIFREKDKTEEELWHEKNKISNKKLLFWWIVPTTITLPLLWFVVPLLLWNWTLYVIIWELFVVVLETIMIKYWLRIPRKKAIIASIVCNIFSFLLLPNNMGGEHSLFVIVLLEGIVFFLVGKLSKGWITNNKLILGSLFIPLGDTLAARFIVRLLKYLDSALLEIIIIIVGKVLVDMLIIKWVRKISWKKGLITSIVCNLCIAAIIFAIIYFFNW